MPGTTLGFKKGSSFESYDEGIIYFETSTHTLKVGTGSNTCEFYSGVRSASWDSTNKVLTIVNQAGTNIELNFADVASAQGVNSLLKTLRDDIDNKIDAPATAGTTGQVLRLDSSGNTEWFSIPTATDYSVTCDSSAEGTTSGYLKTYHLFQNGSEIATIDIPKDLVVTSGSVVAGTWSGTTFTENQLGTDKALKLGIANQVNPVYINVADLGKVYTEQQNAAEVQLAISSSNEISASIVTGSIAATKLDASVQASLLKADSAIQSVTGEAAVTDSSYISVSVDASVNAAKAVTLTSHANITTHDVSTAAANDDGVATAYDVKQYIAAAVVNEWLLFQ